MTNSHQPKTTRKHARTRRGTIVILAVGILAVLAVASLSYMTVVRIDRSSAAAYATEANFRQQVGATSAHIRSLIAADLFGNKIVNGQVPERINTNLVWPRAFEDGEYWDYPSVSSDWLIQPTDPSRDPMAVNGDPTATDYSWRLDFNTTLGRFPPTRSDDAWLASQTPVDTDGNGIWETWPQMTNLRSGWIYRPDPDNPAIPGWWQRDHGRYIDIAEWLTNSQNDAFTLTLGRGDPGLDISVFSTAAAYSTSYADDNESDIGMDDPESGGPNLGIDRDLRAGDPLGTDLEVWEFQMSRMQEFLNGSTINVNEDLGTAASNTENIDDRMFIDTDGDGRADARWQELDALGELFGYRWIVAARIIDNSAMINVNSSLEWQFPDNSDDVGMGRTPADVDLYRLLRRSIDTDNDIDTGIQIGHPDLIANTQLNEDRLKSIWSHHRMNGWKIAEAFSEIDAEWSVLATGQGVPWVPLQPITPAVLSPNDPLGVRERELFWRTAGRSPQRRSTLSAIPVPIGDEIDLRARFGYNYVPFTSKIEDRLEQIDQPTSPQGWLLGLESPGGTTQSYPGEFSLGPMRSKEDGRDLRTFSLTALTPEQDYADTFTQDLKIQRIMADIRRHMTTINGASNVSPIPVLQTALGSGFENQYVNEKIRLDDPDLIREQVSDASDLVGVKQRIEDFVNEAYNSFIWALAPMLTDQPLSSEILPADTGDAMRDEAYGSGPGGRGELLDSSMGQIYAMLRSASLAVNLADALDRDDNQMESPTIARLATSLPPSNVNDREVQIRNTFSHGTIDIASLTGIPTVEQHLGQPNVGVTLVGLDRQPFLTEAVHVALFQDFESIGVGLLEVEIVIDPANPDEQIGSIFFVELGNPWPESIDVSDYSVRLSDSAGEFSFKLTAAATDPYGDPNGSTMIGPGEFKTFYVTFDPTMMEPSFLPIFDDFFNTAFFDELASVTGLALADMCHIEPNAVNSPSMDPAPLASAFGGGVNVPVQLWYEDPSVADLAYLVDRMSNVIGGSFPNLGIPVFNEPITSGFDPLIQPKGSSRFAAIASIRRPKDNLGDGFPHYVIERGANTVANAYASQSWRTEPAPPENQLTYPPSDLPPLILAEQSLGQAVGNYGTYATMPFQLFVPNGPLRSVTELHLLSTFTHMYVNQGAAYDTTQAEANAHLAPAPQFPMTNRGLGNWRTISEQMGENAHFFYDGLTAGPPNPSLGILDPTRYILGSGGFGGDLEATTFSGNEWPDFMRIPLALRVFDCFTVTPSDVPLIQGRINLNTAPIEVLESMPYFAPESDVSSSLAGSPMDLPASSAQNRARLVRDYRDLRPTSPFDRVMLDTRSTLTSLPGLRAGTSGPTAAPLNKPGLVNVGELLAMADWGAGAGPGLPGSGLAGYDDFMQLGVDAGSNDGAPLSLRYAQGVYGSFFASSDFIELGSYANRNDYAGGGFDPSDDAEERLALARSAIDIASTRSDVFTAYFVLRAYNPEQIEIIQTEGILDLQTQASLLDERSSPFPSTGLTPVYESRWMAVFDRSNVTRPNQKPQVLLLVELPID